MDYPPRHNITRTRSPRTSTNINIGRRRSVRRDDDDSPAGVTRYDNLSTRTGPPGQIKSPPKPRSKRALYVLSAEVERHLSPKNRELQQQRLNSDNDLKTRSSHSPPLGVVTSRRSPRGRTDSYESPSPRANRTSPRRASTMMNLPIHGIAENKGLKSLGGSAYDLSDFYSSMEKPVEPMFKPSPRSPTLTASPVTLVSHLQYRC